MSNGEQSSTIEALKRATEALKAIDLTGIKHQEKPVETVGRIRGIACDALKDIEAVLAQPEQEPVAWMKDVGHGIYVDMVKPVGGFYGMCVPLYTTPPQRTWVGLTDEDDIDWDGTGNLKQLVEAVEAKLKEKNT